MTTSTLTNNKRSIIVGSIAILVLALTVLIMVSDQQPEVDLLMPIESAGKPAQDIMPSFELVRIAKNGHAIFSGNAAPGSTVMLNLNNEPLSIVNTDIHGDWIYNYGESLEIGQHVLSINASLKSFADSNTDEILLIDLEKVDPSNDLTQTNNDVIVIAYGSDKGMRVLQKPRLKSKEIALKSTLDQPKTEEISRSVATTSADLVENIGTKIETNINEPISQEVVIDSEQIDPVAAAISAGEQKLENPSYAQITLATMALSKDLSTITITGTAEPNALLRTQINALNAVEGKVNNDGQFIIRAPSDNITSETQSVTITANFAGQDIDTTTALLKPVSVNQTDSQANVRTVTVRKGESLWSLAVRAYGDGTQHRKILQANKDKLKSSQDLKPGMILRIP